MAPFLSGWQAVMVMSSLIIGLNIGSWGENSPQVVGRKTIVALKRLLQSIKSVFKWPLLVGLYYCSTIVCCYTLVHSRLSVELYYSRSC